MNNAKNCSTIQPGGALGGGPGGEENRGGDGDKTNTLSRVPSQKLSVLIRRKNTAIKKERRR